MLKWSHSGMLTCKNTAEMLENAAWIAGLLNYWNAGRLEGWNVGMLECLIAVILYKC